MILDKGLIMQGLDDTALTAEKKCSINFFETQEKFCLNLHYNGYILLMALKHINSNQRF